MHVTLRGRGRELEVKVLPGFTQVRMTNRGAEVSVGKFDPGQWPELEDCLYHAVQDLIRPEKYQKSNEVIKLAVSNILSLLRI